jgi:hypothetical protein
MKKSAVKDIKAQSVIEYSMVIAVFVAAIIAMSGILNAHVRSNWRQNADAFSDEQYQEGTTLGGQTFTVEYLGGGVKAGGSTMSRSYEGDLGCYVWKE